MGVLLYAYAVGLTFYVDDFVHFRWLDRKTLAQIWLSNDWGYYRPVPFTVWKLIHLVFGGYPAALLHAVNVVCHALNGALVFLLLAHRLPERDRAAKRRVAFAAAILFLAFPFSYQAVPWIGSLTHPLATTFILASLLTAGVAHARNSVALRLLSLGWTAIAIVTHETGVVIGPLLLLIDAVNMPALSWRDLARRAWPYFAVGLALPLTIAWLRHAPIASKAVTLESRWQNAVYFLQGLVYSAAPLSAPLMRWLNISDIAAVLLVCLPALAALAVALRAAGALRIAMLAIGWYAVAIAPALLLLPFSYVIDGPRLMYQASIGAALLIAGQLVWLRKTGRRALPAAAFFGVLVPAGALIVSAVFLWRQADMYEQTRRLAAGLLAEMGPSADNAKMAITVNFPSWIAPKQNTYAIGHEGVSFVPNYSSLIDLYYLQTGKEKPVASVVLPNLQTEWRYNFVNHGQAFDPFAIQPSLRQGDRILFVSTKGGDAYISDAGGLEAATDAGTTGQPDPPLAVFDNALRLLTQTHERMEGQRLRITLRWSLVNKPGEGLRTFVHVLSPAGQLVAQEDGLPVMNMSDPRAWEKGDTWRDVRVIVVPADLPAGRYSLRVGVYREADGTRLPAVDAKGNPVADNSVVAGDWIVP